jgi:ABC-type bacteriocin/lantibiotic exporter with double-glycine peptidase domain
LLATEIVYKNLHVKDDVLDSNLKEILQFKEKIFLEKVFFKYPSSKNYVLQNINLVINKGEFIGIVGSSGSGKSTLVDLIAGLLKPTSGNLYLDNLKLPIDKSEKKIDCAYVSQNVFLIDDTIKRNIAFGVDDNEIDINKIERCINYAQLDDFISKLPEGYETVVGERGVKISGGQKQRIGIARALYNDSNLLIFDEATNALDHKTEEELFSTIFKMKYKKTIIFITHKELSLKNFDKIYKIENTELKIKKDI